MLALVKKGKGSRVQLKSSDKSMEDRAIKAIEKAKAQKAKATTDEEKVREFLQGSVVVLLRSRHIEATCDRMTRSNWVPCFRIGL